MNQELVELRCEDCGGTMTIDQEREVISCPFCGSKKIVLDSDAVKIEKIRADKELKKLDKIIEKEEKERKDEAKDEVRVWIMLLSLPFVVLFIYLLIYIFSLFL